MGKRAALGVFGVFQQRGAGGVGQGQVLRVPAAKAGRLQGVQQFALAQGTVKLPFGPGGGVQGVVATGAGAQALEAVFKRVRYGGAVGQLTGRHAGYPIGYLVGCAFGQVHHALGDAEPRQAAAVARALVHGHEHGFGFFAQQLAVGQCAGGHHTHHLALDRAFSGDFAHLFANGHRFAMADQLGQVAFHGVKRHTGHRNGLTRRLATGGEGDVQNRRRFLGVGIKHFVKVAHTVEQQGVGVIGFEPQVLLHHGRVAL